MASGLTARMEGGRWSSFPRAEALGGGCTAGVTPSRAKTETQGGTSPGRVSISHDGGRGKEHRLPGWDHKALHRRCKAFDLKAAACIESHLHSLGLRQSAGSPVNGQWLSCPSQAFPGGYVSRENRTCASYMCRAVKQPSTIPLRLQPACPILSPNPDEDTGTRCCG